MHQNLSHNQAFGFTTYLVRGRLFRKNSFDIIDPSGNIVLRANPPAIISSGKSIFSAQGDELVACQNMSTFKDAYFSGVFRYEFRESAASQIIGGLKGINTKKNPGKTEWQILDSQEMQIGHITEDSSPPEVRYGGKPMHDIMSGFIGNENVFLFKVNIHSFRSEMSVDFTMDGRGALDRKLGIALACLFAGIKRTPPNDT
jgi:hypothetical protein